MSTDVDRRATDNPLIEMTFWVCELQQPLPLTAVPDGIVVRRAASDDVPMLLEARGPERREETLQRFKAGWRAYLAMRGGVVMAYGWVAFGNGHIGDLERDIRLAPGEAYIFDCETLPAYRRRGLYRAILSRIVHDLRAEGLARVWIGALADNVISQRGIARAGFTHVVDLLYQRVGKDRLLLLFPGAQSAPDHVAAAAWALDGEIADARG